MAGTYQNITLRMTPEQHAQVKAAYEREKQSYQSFNAWALGRLLGACLLKHDHCELGLLTTQKEEGR